MFQGHKAVQCFVFIHENVWQGGGIIDRLVDRTTSVYDPIPCTIFSSKSFGSFWFMLCFRVIVFQAVTVPVPCTVVCLHSSSFLLHRFPS